MNGDNITKLICEFLNSLSLKYVYFKKMPVQFYNDNLEHLSITNTCSFVINVFNNFSTKALFKLPVVHKQLIMDDFVQSVEL